MSRISGIGQYPPNQGNRSFTQSTRNRNNYSSNTSSYRKLLTAPLLGLAFLLGCSSEKEKINPTQAQTINQTQDFDIPDEHGLFLSSVDQILKKAKQEKIEKAYLWLNESNKGQPHYEFVLKNGNSQYLLIPNDSKEIEKLEDGLRTLPKEPIYITKGEKAKAWQVLNDATSIAGPILGIVLIVFLIKLLRSASSGGSTNWKPVKSNTRFPDIRGHPEIISRLEKIVKYIKDSDKNKVGAQLPKGILLTGKPGTGKTLIARAIAGEADVPFIAATGSDFIEMFAGLAARRVRKLFGLAKKHTGTNKGIIKKITDFVIASRIRSLFKEAKKQGHCIIFIDELDAIGGARGSSSSEVSKEYTQAINELLNQMDGFNQSDGITVIAATNRPELLDPALTRPGRFDLKIEVPEPITGKERKDILDLYLDKKRLNNQLAMDVDAQKLAENTVGFVGADLKNLVDISALIAFENDKGQITMEDFNQAITEINLGIKRENIITEKDRWTVGVHEVAGHGVIGLTCNRKLEMVSMIPRGKSLGHVRFSQNDHSQIMPSKTELLQDILGLMGGRAAEMILLSDCTPGALNDYKEARKIIRLMLSSGMFEGHISNDYYSDQDKELSKKDAELMDEVIDNALSTCLRILEQMPREDLEALVEESLEAGELKGEDALALYEKHLNGVNWDLLRKPVKSYISNPIVNIELKDIESGQKVS